MPIPPRTIDGVLPPFVGPHGPGGASQDMTPYGASAYEIALTFGGSERRRDILRGWIGYRTALRAAGIVRGFQWIDGSFVEEKEPGDIDVITFLYRPPSTQTLQDRMAWHATNAHLFDRGGVKARFMVDALYVDLNGSPEAIVDATRYYGSLFSHRRGDNLWKGMLSVRLEDPADDQAALAAIAPPATASAAGAAP